MAAEVRRCRQCLLREMLDAEGAGYYESVKRYRATLPAKKRTPDDAYEQRVTACKQCESLDNGTCMQCGCYVELRAARSDMHCPATPQSW